MITPPHSPQPPPLIHDRSRNLAPLPQQVQRDAAGRITEDIACRSCGYNLRGLALESQCPECQTAVERSVQGDLLRLCEPRWVERLALGALLVIIGVISGIALGMAAGVVGAVLGGMAQVSPAVIMALVAGVSFVTALVSVAGFWFLTTPDPGASETNVMSVRSIARYCLLAALIAAPMQLLANPQGGLSNVRAGYVFGGTQLALGIVAITAVLVQAIGYYALFEYARQLASRMPSSALVKQARIVKWGYLIMQIMAALSAAAMLIAMPKLIAAMTAAAPPPPPPPPASGGATATVPVPPGPGISAMFSGWFFAVIAFNCILAPIALVFQIWAIVLLFIFRSKFQQAAKQARATWAAARFA